MHYIYLEGNRLPEYIACKATVSLTNQTNNHFGAAEGDFRNR